MINKLLIYDIERERDMNYHELILDLIKECDNQKFGMVSVQNIVEIIEKSQTGMKTITDKYKLLIQTK